MSAPSYFNATLGSKAKAPQATTVDAANAKIQTFILLNLINGISRVV